MGNTWIGELYEQQPDLLDEELESYVAAGRKLRKKRKASGFQRIQAELEAEKNN
jgi:hypothetical protein